MERFALYCGEEHKVAVYAELNVVQRGAVCPAELQSAYTADCGCDVYFLDAPVFPFAVDYKTAARAKPLEMPVSPVIGERGQKLNNACVALQKHFANARCGAEVAVYLERRVCAPKVGKNIIFNKSFV
jgi:hypothetical protein